MPSSKPEGSERWVILTTDEDGTQHVLGPIKEVHGRCTYNDADEAEEATATLPEGTEFSLVILEELG